MSKYGIIGDSVGTDLPEMEVDKESLDAEKRAAKFSKTKEFQVLKKHLEDRIAHYQTFLPDGRPVADLNPDGNQNWIIANAVIGEMKAIISAYESARQVVEDVQR